MLRYETESIEQEKTYDDFTVEITDIPDQTENGLRMSAACVVREWQRSPKKRRYVRWLNRLGIALLLVILFSLNNGFSLLIMKSFNTPSLHPLPESTRCLIDAAWSPDSSVIAVLSYQHNCFQAGATGALTLYDTNSRKVMTRLHPDDAIVHALGNSVSFPLKRPFTINYVHVVWSPDGHRLACTFDTISAQPLLNGVLLIDRDGSHTQVLLQRQFSTAPFYAEWDVVQNRPITFTPPPTAFALMPLPPALAYRWGENGTVVPETRLSSTTLPLAPSPGPVGNPTGGTSFTIWQPGSVSVGRLADRSALYTWSTAFAAWSSDGRYLIDGIALFGVLKLPGQRFPGSSTLVVAVINGAPLLSLHDAALLRTLDTATAFAWSPNGRVLAAYHAGKSVDLYNCANGHRLASLELEEKNAAVSLDFILLRWSPDGAHLLLASVLWGRVTLWGHNQPQAEVLSDTSSSPIESS